MLSLRYHMYCCYDCRTQAERAAHATAATSSYWFSVEPSEYVPPHALRSLDAAVAALSLPALAPRRFSLSSYWRSWARKPSLGQMAGRRDCTKLSACSYVMASAGGDGVLPLATAAGCAVHAAAVALWGREVAEVDGCVTLLASGRVASESEEEEADSATAAVEGASPSPSPSASVSSHSVCSACRGEEESGWAP